VCVCVCVWVYVCVCSNLSVACALTEFFPRSPTIAAQLTPGAHQGAKGAQEVFYFRPTFDLSACRALRWSKALSRVRRPAAGKGAHINVSHVYVSMCLSSCVCVCVYVCVCMCVCVCGFHQLAHVAPQRYVAKASAHPGRQPHARPAPAP
jgi:hypothetical protein